MQKQRKGDLVAPPCLRAIAAVVPQGIVVAAGPGKVTQDIGRGDRIVRLVEAEFRHADLTARTLDVGIGDFPVIVLGGAVLNLLCCFHCRSPREMRELRRRLSNP